MRFVLLLKRRGGQWQNNKTWLGRVSYCKRANLKQKHGLALFLVGLGWETTPVHGNVVSASLFTLPRDLESLILLVKRQGRCLNTSFGWLGFAELPVLAELNTLAL